MAGISRRTFLEMSAASVAAAGTRGAIAQATDGAKASSAEQPRAVRAREPAPASAEKSKTRVAVMGLNNRGKQLLPTFLDCPNVEIAYLCDPDSSVIAPALKLVTERNRKDPKVVSDFRKALDDTSVDVLVCAAPDHWHALATVWACQAGKDVYVEKPCSHNPAEGRAMVRAARTHQRVVQVGTQRRSADDLVAAVERVRSGRLGKVHLARAWITSVRPNIGRESSITPPPSLDFDLWAGPAINPHYQKNLVPYHWHWRWLYGTGECGNNGVHGLDIARWGLGVDAPEYVSSGGRKYHFDDDQETPDTQFATFDFANAAIEWEHRTWNKRGLEDHEFGVVFYGTDATLVALDRGWKIYQDRKIVEEHAGTGHADWEGRHVRNFLDCCRTRQRPNADIEIGHQSTLLCHLANIAWRTRSTLRFDAASERIPNNAAAMRLWAREYRRGYDLPSVG
ncbi:MAG TPA: Gfo/Idh/MocA family oxidoreductase [Planctomycetaceae bacterium]|jgi:predicted dehydrogenase|nr:Gfo/Idh/MocA family oxidoreductase [Planctomycetaceae bacterium]